MPAVQDRQTVPDPQEEPMTLCNWLKGYRVSGLGYRGTNDNDDCYSPDFILVTLYPIPETRNPLTNIIDHLGGC